MAQKNIIAAQTRQTGMLSVDEINLLNSQLKLYAYSDFDYFDYKEQSYYVNEFPKAFLKYKELYPDVFSNYFIGSGFLKVKKASKDIPIDRIEFDSVTSLQNEVKDRIRKSWLDLFEKHPRLANALVKYSHFTGGLEFSVNGFSQFIPIEAKTNFIKDSNGVSHAEFSSKLMEYAESGDFFKGFRFQFFRHNFHKSNFVPRVDDKSAVIVGNTITIDLTKPNSKLFWKDFTGVSTVPYVSYVGKDNKIRGYKLSNQTEETATYTLEEALGIKNFVFEYNKYNTDNSPSVIKANNLKVDNKVSSNKVLSDIDTNDSTHSSEPVNPIIKKSASFGDYEFTIANGTISKVTVTRSGVAKDITATYQNAPVLKQMIQDVLKEMNDKHCN
jgi:hypothetical protein